jgi:hypothetical protein
MLSRERNSFVLQKLSGKWTASVFIGCAPCNTWTNVAITWWNTSTLFSRRNGIFEEKAEGWWPGRNGPEAWTVRSPDFSPLNFFLWVGDYRGGKREETHQLVEGICKAAVDIRNELGRVQCHYGVAEQLTAAHSVMVGILNMCCHDLETSTLLEA